MVYIILLSIQKSFVLTTGSAIHSHSLFEIQGKKHLHSLNKNITSEKSQVLLLAFSRYWAIYLKPFL